MEIRKIGIIGLGNMGEVLLKGLLSISPKVEIRGSDVKPERCDYIKQNYDISTLDNKSLAKESDCIILAVKPQDAKVVLNDIKMCVEGRRLIISIMAGVRIGYLEDVLGRDLSIVRIMPNTPALVGKGVSVISYNKNVNEEERLLVKDLFSNLGWCYEAEEENLDIVTAVSGSGPAYFFYFVNALMKASIANGLDEDTAKALTVGTIAGSAELILKGGLSPQELIKKVASKGGTTEAALRVFEERKLSEIVKEAVEAAIKRSRELSSKL